MTYKVILNYFCNFIISKKKTNKLKKMTRPDEYNLVIGITSLWLLIPVSGGLLSIFKIKKPIFMTSILIFWTFTSSCLSTVMWKSYKKNRFLYKLDLICATTEFIILLLYSIFFNQFSIWINFSFPFGLLTMYIITDHYNNSHNWLANTWSHITFRYIGYWWCYVVLINDKNIWRSFILQSFVYYCHIFIKIKLIFSNKSFDINKNYKSSVLEMIFIIILTSIL